VANWVGISKLGGGEGKGGEGGCEGNGKGGVALLLTELEACFWIAKSHMH
jgi:hypothetical protein